MLVVRQACDLPAADDRSLSQWDGPELARHRIREGVVTTISPQTVQRILARCRLKPWRRHLWLHPRTPRDRSRPAGDAAFVPCVRNVADLYTRVLLPTEVVLSLDEQTSIPPRPRRTATRPARPGDPIQVEHAYARAGARHRFAAFDTRSGRVYGLPFRRKCQGEYLALLEHLDRTIPAHITTIHLIADNVSVHHGQQVRQWLAQHPRFVPHFTPVHCSWMNPVEHWFSILQRKRLRHPNFRDLADLAAKIAQFIDQWHTTAHPFRWTAASFDKLLATVDAALPEAA